MMGFLLRLLKRFGNWLLNPARQSGPPSAQTGDYLTLPRALDAKEVVSRFLHGDRHYSIEKRRAKPGAFDPFPYTELSAAHITGLSDAEVWTVARGALSERPPRDKINARVDLPVAELLEHELRAERDDDPFVRHALILGWPALEDQDLQKKALKEICLKLSQSARATLVVASPPITRI